MPDQGAIALTDISHQITPLRAQILDAIASVADSRHFIGGPWVERFEGELARYVGAREAVSVNSGTDALLLALRALDIGPGDEVIVPAFSFYASAEAVSLLGATPVFADIRADTFNLDVDDAAQRITPRTRAIVAVHLYGQPAAMDELTALTRKHGLALLEDAAQALGATYKGRPVGALGTAGALSFYPSKNLGALGDGGAIITNDSALADRLRRLRNHGQRSRGEHDEIGQNSRLDALQAAVLSIKLPYLAQWNHQRRQLAAAYTAELGSIPGLFTPKVDDQVEHVFHQYTITVPAGRRPALRKALSAEGIETGIYYPRPLHRLAPYLGDDHRLPKADAAATQVLSLPIWPGLPEGTTERAARAARSVLDMTDSI
jgi:dTDP-4-amino-4,6-dideoxygalactose transaminase